MQRNFLVVEDEPLIRMLWVELIEREGHNVAGVASTVETALHVLDTMQVHAAILDYNLNGTKCTPIAARLQEMGIPAIVATGHGLDLLEPEFNSYPCLIKPFKEEAASSLIGKILL